MKRALLKILMGTAMLSSASVSFAQESPDPNLSFNEWCQGYLAQDQAGQNTMPGRPPERDLSQVKTTLPTGPVGGAATPETGGTPETGATPTSPVGEPTTTVPPGNKPPTATPPKGNPNIALPTGSAAKCNKGVQMSKSDRASINRALAAKATLQAAAKRHGIDWRILAALGIRETNFRPIDSTIKGDPGMGIFQLTNQKGVTRAQAFDLTFSANYAAKLIKENMTLLKRRWPKFTEAELLQATFASYNFGPNNIKGVPANIDKGTTRNNYGENILLLMNCF